MIPRMCPAGAVPYPFTFVHLTWILNWINENDLPQFGHDQTLTQYFVHG